MNIEKERKRINRIRYRVTDSVLDKTAERILASWEWESLTLQEQGRRILAEMTGEKK